MPLAATWMDLDIMMLSEISQKEKEKYCMTSLLCRIFKKWYKWTYLWNRNFHRKHLWLPWGESGGEIVMEFWINMYTMLYLKWITNRVQLYSTGTLHNIMWQPGWEGSWEKMNTHICMAESLRCPPEIFTTLLISYIPIQNKKKVYKK